MAAGRIAWPPINKVPMMPPIMAATPPPISFPVYCFLLFRDGVVAAFHDVVGHRVSPGLFGNRLITLAL